MISATAAIRSLKCRTFFGNSSTIVAMPIRISAKAKRRAASEGSHEVTQESAHQMSSTVKIGRANSVSRRGS